MKLSIIIPVYNVEKYIKGTLESIFSQGVDNALFEVIVVNDGTPDNSMDVVSDFAKKYNNLIVVSQCNAGLGAARNTGVRHAAGDFVWFVDSDDKIVENSIEEIIRIVDNHNAEIYYFAIKNVEEATGRLWVDYPILKDTSEDLYNKIVTGYDLSNKIAIGISQKNIYNRKFFISRGLWYDESIIHEDNEQGVRVLAEALKCYCSKTVIYQYLRRTSGSITTSNRFKSIKSQLDTIKIWEEYISRFELSKQSKHIVYHYIFLQIYNLFLTSDEVLKELKFDKFVFKKKAIYAFKRSLHFHSKGKILRLLFLLFNLKIKMR